MGKIKTPKRVLPLIPDFTATTVLRAFILNALAIAAIATLTVEMRVLLDERKNDVYSYLHKWLIGNNKNIYLTERQKLIIVFFDCICGCYIGVSYYACAFWIWTRYVSCMPDRKRIRKIRFKKKSNFLKGILQRVY